MDKTFNFVALFIAFLTSIELAYSQEEEKSESKKHTIGITISHARIFEGKDDLGNRKTLILPAWGLDYDYQLNSKWSIGLHTDIVLEKFLVSKHLDGKDKESEILERNYPISPAAMMTYKLGDHWSVLFGAGIEFASEKNLYLNRLGIEYGIEIDESFEVAASFNYDIMWGAYDSWLLGLGIFKSF